MKRLAKNSPSAGSCVSVDWWIVRILVVFILREEREKNLSLGKENLPANESISEINRVERLDEEIRGPMNVPVEETQTVTKVNV